MNDTEEAVWLNFKDVATKSLNSNKDWDYKSVVKNIMNYYKKLGYLRNWKLHFLDSHTIQLNQK